jgi:chorismate mutase
MITSGASNFSLDLNDVVEEAFERCGSELRTGYDLRTARRSLNLLFADWANRGINMWTFEQDVIPLVTGQPTYALPDDTVDLLEHVIRTNANVPNNQADLSITRISVSTYATIPNKLIQGRPIQVYIQRLTAQDSVLPGTLQANITAAATSIPVTSMVGIPNAGFITIGSELIFFNEFTPATDTAPAYLLNCCRGQAGTTAASHNTGATLILSQKQSVTVWPTPNAGTDYQLVYWRMRRVQDAANSGVKGFDVPFRFLPCLAAGLAYYLAMKIPNAGDRLPMLKQQYDEAWQLAADEDREKAAVRFVPRPMFLGGGSM